MAIILKKESGGGSYTKEDVDSREPTEVIAYSVSQLNMALRCPRQRYFRYRLGLKIPPSGAMILGQGVHKGAELSLKEKQRTGKLLSTGDAREICAEHTKKVLKEPWDGEENAADLIDDSVVMMETWQDKVGPQKRPLHPEADEWPEIFEEWESKVKPIDFFPDADEEEEVASKRKVEPFSGIEASFSINLPGLVKPVIGYIDIIEQIAGKKVVVTDTKTSGRKKTENDLRTYQLWLYAIVAKMVGLDPTTLALDVIIRPRKTLPSGEYQPLGMDVSSNVPYQHTVSAFRHMEKMDEEGAYPPNYGQHCSWCGYKTLCDQISAAKTFPV